MDDKNYMDQFNSPEEFIVHEICANRGTQNVLEKSKLLSLANTYGLSVHASMSKYDLCKMLFEVVPLEKITPHCKHLGVGAASCRKKFGITNQQLKTLAAKGVIRVSGKQRFYGWGKYREADLYDVYDYFGLTHEEVHTALK